MYKEKSPNFLKELGIENRLVIENFNQIYTRDLRYFFSWVDYKKFNATIKEQLGGYRAMFLVNRPSDSIDDAQVIEGGFVKNIDKICGKMLILATGLSFQNKAELCLGLKVRRNSMGKQPPYVATVYWVSRELDCNCYKELCYTPIVNFSGVAHLLSHIHEVIEADMRDELIYTAACASDNDLNSGTLFFKIKKKEEDIKIQIKINKYEDDPSLYIVDEGPLRENSRCPTPYRKSELALDLYLLFSENVLETLVAQLKDCTQHIPCGWDYWLDEDQVLRRNGTKNTTLGYYLEGVLSRLCEDRARGDSLAIVEQEGILWFCTGLRAKQGGLLYGAISESRDGVSWYYADSKCLPKTLPKPPNWTRCASDLVYDREALLAVNGNDALGHILAKHWDRFPILRRLSARERTTRINEAIERAKCIAQENYRAVIPNYYRGKVGLLLPLFLEKRAKATETPDAFLVLNRKEDGCGYTVPTILTPAMAFYSARIIAPGAWVEWEDCFFSAVREQLQDRDLPNYGNIEQLKCSKNPTSKGLENQQKGAQNKDVLTSDAEEIWRKMNQSFEAK